MKIRTQNRPAGFSSLAFLGHLSALVLLTAGCQGIYVTLKNIEPLEITTREYIEQKPAAEWLVLKDGEVSLTEAAYKAWMGGISEVFIPVRPSGQSLHEPIHILLSTEDEAVVEALKKLSQYGGTKDKTVKVASRQADTLFLQKNISGVIRYGLVADLVTRFKLSRLNLNLAHDFVILNDGTSPSLYPPLAMLAGGLLIWFFMLCEAIRVALWHRRQRKRWLSQQRN